MTNIVVSGARRAPLADVQRSGARAARGLAGLGVGEGGAVAVMMRNDIQFIEAMTAAALLGAYAVPVNWHFTGEETGYVIDDSDAQVLIIHADLLPRVSDHVPAGLPVFVVATPPEIAAAYAIADEACVVPPDMTAWDDWRDQFEPWDQPPAASRGGMIYTSGTTGRPKGVRRSPASPELQATMVERAIESFGLRTGCNAALTGPLYHSAPYGYTRTILQAGGSIHLMPRFDPEGLLKLIEAERLTHMHIVPTMFVRLTRLPKKVRRRYDLSSLEGVIHGAAPCPPHVKREMIAWWGPVIREYYGSTEAGLVTIATSDEWLARPGTVGRPTRKGSVRILGAEGAPLPPGQAGEVYMSLRSMTDFTYHKRDEARREIERSGFVTNGDIGYLDDDGYLFLSDRKRDMVISGGVNIYPAEIEAVLIALPGVHDCAVFGIPDEEFGETIAAAVALSDGASLDENDVKDHLSKHLARYKVPNVVTFHDAMPREDSGKIYKRKLREPYWRDAGRQI